MSLGPVESPDELIPKAEVLRRIQNHVDYRNSYAEYTAGIRRDEAMLLFAEVSRVEPVDPAVYVPEREGTLSDHGVYSGHDTIRVYHCRSCKAEWVSDILSDYCPRCGIKFKKEG